MLLLLLTKEENFHLMHLDFLPLTRSFSIMNQDQSASTELTIKSSITLETIPEDIAEVIAEIIKSWATIIEGNLERREKERK